MRETTPSPNRGIFITFEGGDGVGKSTHIAFLARRLREQGFEVVCLREPGGTAIGEALRKVVLDPENAAMCPECELLVYEAARAQIVAEVIKPALERGAVVLCDRFFDSTVAYQAFGRGLARESVDAANAFAAQGVVPDRTLLLTCPTGAAVTLQRATHKNGADRLEAEGVDFHDQVNDAFLQIAQSHPERIRIIEADGPKSLTSASIFLELGDLFPWMTDASLCSEEYFGVLDQGAGAASL